MTNELNLVKNEQDPVISDKDAKLIGLDTTSTPLQVVESHTRIATRLHEAVNARPKVNRSADLVPLSHNFETLRKQMYLLIESCKKYQDTLTIVDKAHSEVVKNVAAMVDTTPYSGDSKNSIAALSNDVTTNIGRLHDKYSNDVLDYAMEWETIVTSRVDAELKEAESLRARLEHYQSKVYKLRKDINSQGEKAKKEDIERLERNEMKLEKVWAAHESYASKTCHLLEEVTHYGWKDLHPLLVNMLKFDEEFGRSLSTVFAKLPSILEEMEKTYELNNVDPSIAPMTTQVASPPLSSDSDEEGTHFTNFKGTGGASAPSLGTKTASRSEHTSPKGVMGLFGKK